MNCCAGAAFLCSGFHGADAQCVCTHTHTLRRLARRGSPLKVAVQTASLRLNGHFLWSGCGACLADRAKPLSPSLAGSEIKLVWCWSPARALILAARYEGLHSWKQRCLLLQSPKTSLPWPQPHSNYALILTPPAVQYPPCFSSRQTDINELSPWNLVPLQSTFFVCFPYESLKTGLLWLAVLCVRIREYGSIWVHSNQTQEMSESIFSSLFHYYSLFLESSCTKALIMIRFVVS